MGFEFLERLADAMTDTILLSLYEHPGGSKPRPLSAAMRKLGTISDQDRY
jgi:hypothetical protein